MSNLEFDSPITGPQRSCLSPYLWGRCSYGAHDGRADAFLVVSATFVSLFAFSRLTAYCPYQTMTTIASNPDLNSHDLLEVKHFEALRQALIKCTSRSYAPSLSRSHHNAARPRASLPTSLYKRGVITTSKISATAFLFVSLAGCVFCIAESNSRSSNGGFGERLTISELRTESDDQDDGFILKEIPFPEQTPFVYPSLTQDNKTRLLMLEPGSFNDELKCKVEPVDRLEDHKYEALSYFWGKRPGTITELSAGKPIHITANCEAALRRLRYENDTRLLWVDAICINQSDKA
jgi:hypothetical protein